MKLITFHTKGYQRVIHYHGTPVGGQRVHVPRFLDGRHALVSYAYPEDIGVVANVCQSFVLDSGAFTVWKQGHEFDVNGYLKFCWKWGRHPSCDWSLIPDVIDGTEEENDRLIGEWPENLRGCPVWHLHESLDRLARLADEWPVVAFGSSGAWPIPGQRRWHDRMTEAMEVVCDSEGVPNVRIHGLRMLNTNIFTIYPFASADSTNAVQNSVRQARRIGDKVNPVVGAVIIADRVESYQSPERWERERQKLLWSCEEQLSFF